MNEPFDYAPLSLAADGRRAVYTVSQVNREARTLLEKAFPLLWIEGEISNFSAPASGHWYFTLKDGQAQIRCAMFRNRNLPQRFRPKDGMQVMVRAQITLYEGRGEFQLVVEHLEEAGLGALQRAFEALKLKLQTEGLFHPEHKRPLPRWPRRVGVISSPTGAAIRDILSTLKRRWPGLCVCLYPVPVQGADAAPAMIAALRTASLRLQEDVLILARGGGSLEDLWAFNDEDLARAIRACAIPVVCGVGHEIDFTIADLAADLRAPTPTAAAELICPDQKEWRPQVVELETRLRRAIGRHLSERAQRLDGLRQRLQDPGRRIDQVRQRIRELEQRLFQQMRRTLQAHRARLAHTAGNLVRCGPGRQLPGMRQDLLRLETALARQGTLLITGRRERLRHWSRQLDLVSPLKVLDRGYAIASDPQGAILQDSRQVQAGDAIRIRLAKGRLACRVTESAHEGSAGPSPGDA